MKRILCVFVIATAFAGTLFCEDNLKPKMVQIPGRNYEMMTTEVTQGLYESVMDENPSHFSEEFKAKYRPVEEVSWYDAIYFCNKLSEKEGLELVYAVNGKKNVSQWNYTTYMGNEIEGKITQDLSANGYRLPTREEWVYAAKGGKDYAYAGSDDIDEVAWYEDNSGKMTHPVTQKKANGYKLYDMSGNVWEWCWDVDPDHSDRRCVCGGSWFDDYCELGNRVSYYADRRDSHLGFRLVRSLSKFCEDNLKPKMVRIPGRNYEMMTTEVTQGLYESVMGENPSYFRNDNEDLDDEERDNLPENTKNNPVECVSWYDAIYFCNLLSKSEGLEAVYAVDGETDVEMWSYIPHYDEEIAEEITQNPKANGYRLPTVEEWQYAAKGGKYYAYAGSDDIDEVGWYDGNSGNTTHLVGQKKANSYGLYDMSGNVEEWCWGGFSYNGNSRFFCCGGGWYYSADYCEAGRSDFTSSRYRGYDFGFRLVRSFSK